MVDSIEPSVLSISHTVEWLNAKTVYMSKVSAPYGGPSVTLDLVSEHS